MKKLMMILVAMVMFACAPALAETCSLDKQNRGWSDGQCPSYYRK